MIQYLKLSILAVPLLFFVVGMMAPHERVYACDNGYLIPSPTNHFPNIPRREIMNT